MLNCAAAWHVLGDARQWARSFENVTCVTQPALLLLCRRTTLLPPSAWT